MSCASESRSLLGAVVGDEVGGGRRRHVGRLVSFCGFPSSFLSDSLRFESNVGNPECVWVGLLFPLLTWLLALHGQCVFGLLTRLITRGR